MIDQRLRCDAYALLYAQSLPRLQRVARDHGYALAVHGSNIRRRKENRVDIVVVLIINGCITLLLAWGCFRAGYSKCLEEDCKTINQMINTQRDLITMMRLSHSIIFSETEEAKQKAYIDYAKYCERSLAKQEFENGVTNNK